MIKSLIRSLPEFRARSSVRKKGLSGHFKYWLFLIEPHWQVIKANSKNAKKATLNVATILYSSRRGRVIIAQTLTIALLLGLFAWWRLPEITKPTTSFAQSQSKELLDIRRFLPKAENFIPPKPYKPFSAENKNALPLYIWLAPWNLNDQKDQIQQYASISAFWLTLEENGYDLKLKGDLEPFLDLTSGVDRAKTDLWLSISGDPNFVFKALTDTEVETRLIDNLMVMVQKYEFTGVDLDFEMLGEDNRFLFTEFVRHLTDRFHLNNKKVAVTLEARIGNAPMDWTQIGEISDETRIMIYDYHARNTGNPGPIAPLGWYKEKLEEAKINLPMEKTVFGVGYYGYDWVANDEPDALHKFKGLGVSFDSALDLAAEHNAPIYRAGGNDERGFDIGDAPHFSYQDEEQKLHQVWFEDFRSIQAKWQLISAYQPKGIIFWHLGLGDTLSALWQDQITKTDQANELPDENDD